MFLLSCRIKLCIFHKRALNYAHSPPTQVRDIKYLEYIWNTIEDVLNPLKILFPCSRKARKKQLKISRATVPSHLYKKHITAHTPHLHSRR
jgi:hypothetical protein